MNNLLMPQDNNLEASNARDVSERIAALNAASQLGAVNTDTLIADADIVLAWLRAGRAVVTPTTPPDAQNGTEEPSTPTDGQEEPLSP